MRRAAHSRRLATITIANVPAVVSRSLRQPSKRLPAQGDRTGRQVFLSSRTVAETHRLRTLQQPSQIERLLESLVSHTELVPSGAYPIRDLKSVPRELRSIAAQATKQGRAWACWAQSFRNWLFIGEMSLALSRERGRPVLKVDVHDESGFKDSGLWMPDRDGRWHRCEG
jgi:hypothetical protein